MIETLVSIINQILLQNQQWPRKKKNGKREVQKLESAEDKRKFFGKIKSIFDNFLKVLF